MINLSTSCSEGTLLSVAEIAVLKLQTCVQVCFNKCSCMRVCFKVDKDKKRMELLKNRPFSIPIGIVTRSLLATNLVVFYHS